MFGLLGSLFTGGAGLLGSLFSSSTSAANNERNIAMQRETNQMNMEEAARNRDFQHGEAQLGRDFTEQMSNTAYQRARHDMETAGLNPMAMFGSGGPASTPSASIATGSQGRADAPQARENPGRPFEALGDIVGKSFATANMIQQTKLGEAQEDRTRSEEHKNDAEVFRIKADTIRSQKEAGLIGERTATQAAETAIKQNEAITAKNIAGIDSTVRKAGDVTAWGANKASSVTDLVGSMVSSALRARGLTPRRSTVERSDNRGGSSFEERWNY